MRNERWKLLLIDRGCSSVVVDYLCDQAIDQGMGVACFSYDFASREAQSSTNMLGSLLRQLLSELDAILLEIRQRYRGQKKVIGGRGLHLPGILKVFPTISSLQRTFICVDALDECIPKHLPKVPDALGQILQRSPNTRVFMTGRSRTSEGRPSISSAVGYEGVRQPVKLRVRRRVKGREAGKLWLVFSCIDSRGHPPLCFSLNQQQSLQQLLLKRLLLY